MKSNVFKKYSLSFVLAACLVSCLFLKGHRSAEHERAVKLSQATEHLVDSDDLLTDTEVLRVATYNILFEYSSRIPADESEQWESRKRHMRQTIEDLQLDVIGTQESQNYQLDEIVQWDDFAWVGGGRSTGANANKYEEHAAILFRKSKLHLVGNGDFWFSDTPDIPGSHSWDSPCCPRMCTWAKFKDKTTGEVFFVFNVHFDHMGELSRKNSSLLLMQKVEEIAGSGLPVIITGDFNAREDSEPIKIIKEKDKFKDARSVSNTIPKGVVGTFHGFRDMEPDNSSRIDWIFVNGKVDVLNYRVVDDELQTKKWASDHLPIVVNVKLK